MNRKELIQKLEDLNVSFSVKDSSKRLQSKLDKIETVAIKAFTLLDNGTLQTGGIGRSKKTLFEVGKTYTLDNEKPLELCANGFHFYKTRDACFGSGLFGPNTVFHRIIAYGEVISDTMKCVAHKLKVCERVDLKLDDTSNSGHNNSGDCNSGHGNSGDKNSGHYNSGHNNSGNSNSGNRNSGHNNSGYYNSGGGNSGHGNSGNNNSWNNNSGNNNSGNNNSGGGYRNHFCEETKFFLFDIEVSEGIIAKVNYIDMSWFSLENKTYHEAWKECPESVLEEFSRIAEFQTKEAKEKFKRITGLSI